MAISLATLVSVAVFSAPDYPQTYLFDGKVLVESRSKLQHGSSKYTYAYNQLVHYTKELIPEPGSPWSVNTGPWSVLNKTLKVPAGMSPHEYLSIGIYNHPCNALPPKCKPYPGGHLLPPDKCDKSTGLPWEPCDGIRNPDAIEEGDAPRAGDMMHAINTLSLTSFFCANETTTVCESWAARAAVILKVWFVDEATMMEPNLFYGQISPRATPPTPSHGGFIEWTGIPLLLDNIALLSFAYPQLLMQSEHDAIMQWFVEFNEYVTSKTAAGERDMTNNHGTWFDSTWQGVALHTGNMQNASVAASEVLHRRIDKQISADGKEWIELERANPSGYCQYNLAALINNAEQVKHGKSGSDVWAYESVNGSSVRKVLDWLLPYATGKEKWPYSQNSDQPTWGGMFPSFRRASVAYNNETYERASCECLKQQQQQQQRQQFSSPGLTQSLWASESDFAESLFAVDYDTDVLNLLVPPIFEISC